MCKYSCFERSTKFTMLKHLEKLTQKMDCKDTTKSIKMKGIALKYVHFLIN